MTQIKSSLTCSGTCRNTINAQVNGCSFSSYICAQSFIYAIHTSTQCCPDSTDLSSRRGPLQASPASCRDRRYLDESPLKAWVKHMTMGIDSFSRQRSLNGSKQSPATCLGDCFGTPAQTLFCGYWNALQLECSSIKSYWGMGVERLALSWLPKYELFPYVGIHWYFFEITYRYAVFVICSCNI